MTGRTASGLKMLAGVVVFIAAEAIAILLVWSIGAHAHDATPTPSQPSGWKYPTACCSGIDCREVTDRAIEETRFGYRIAATGETVIYSDTRIKDSPDGRIHWCSVQGADNGRTICLFVPPKGF